MDAQEKQRAQIQQAVLEPFTSLAEVANDNMKRMLGLSTALDAVCLDDAVKVLKHQRHLIEQDRKRVYGDAAEGDMEEGETNINVGDVHYHLQDVAQLPSNGTPRGPFSNGGNGGSGGNSGGSSGSSQSAPVAVQPPPPPMLPPASQQTAQRKLWPWVVGSALTAGTLAGVPGAIAYFRAAPDVVDTDTDTIHLTKIRPYQGDD